MDGTTVHVRAWASTICLQAPDFYRVGRDHACPTGVALMCPICASTESRPRREIGVDAGRRSLVRGRKAIGTRARCAAAVVEEEQCGNARARLSSSREAALRGGRQGAGHGRAPWARRGLGLEGDGIATLCSRSPARAARRHGVSRLSGLGYAIAACPNPRTTPASKSNSSAARSASRISPPRRNRSLSAFTPRSPTTTESRPTTSPLRPPPSTTWSLPPAADWRAPLPARWRRVRSRSTETSSRPQPRARSSTATECS